MKDIFCVIPPASPSWIFVCLTLSRIEVFPWSTCPATVTIGWRIFFVFVMKGFRDLGLKGLWEAFFNPPFFIVT